eukprot:1555323-Pleurochrysis_carterae.AAC.2
MIQHATTCAGGHVTHCTSGCLGQRVSEWIGNRTGCEVTGSGEGDWESRNKERLIPADQQSECERGIGIRATAGAGALVGADKAPQWGWCGSHKCRYVQKWVLMSMRLSKAGLGCGHGLGSDCERGAQIWEDEIE